MRRHLEGCPSCQRQMERTQTLRQLISLKRFEQPQRLEREHAIALIRSRLEGEPVEKNVAPLERLAELFTAPQPRHAAYGIAALLLIAVGLFSMTTNVRPPETAVFVEQPSRGSTSLEQVVATTNLVAEERSPAAVLSLQTASNRTPTLMQYGPAKSVPVKYEY